MKFLVDSCISKFAVEALRKAGFEALITVDRFRVRVRLKEV
ncbi:hypothetical protein [Thermodesulfovibrio sp. TK110]